MQVCGIKDQISDIIRPVFDFNDIILNKLCLIQWSGITEQPGVGLMSILFPLMSLCECLHA